MAANSVGDYEIEVCPNCGELVSRLENSTGWCLECSPKVEQAESFLSRNADHIEHYVLRGNSVNAAIALVYSDLQNHRRCHSCGAVIIRAGKNALFCRKKPQCRRAVKRYVYLYERKGLTKAEALAQILQEINGSD